MTGSFFLFSLKFVTHRKTRIVRPEKAAAKYGGYCCPKKQTTRLGLQPVSQVDMAKRSAERLTFFQKYFS